MNFLSGRIALVVVIAGIIALGYQESTVLASTTDGTIDTTNRYAWSEAGTWIDFGSTQGNVHVTDTSLSGYGWSSELGWISLNCLNDSSCATVNYSVTNDAEGNLSGYAYSESVGWLDFSPAFGDGVTISATGIFSGYAWSDQAGWISFNCSNDTSCATQDYKVVTDWRPSSARIVSITPTPTPVTSVSSSGSRIRYQNVVVTGGGAVDTVNKSSNESSDQTADQTASIGGVIKSLVGDFFGSNEDEPDLESAEKAVTETAPLAMTGKWSLLPQSSIKSFVFGPLPKEIRVLAQKFPELGKTFDRLGITKVTDLDRLGSATFVLPGLSKEAGMSGGTSIAIADLTPSQKKLIPSEIIFAKSGELIDHSIAVSLSEDGSPIQEISTIVGRPIDLAVKADEPVENIKGFLVVKDLNRQMGERTNVPASSLLAAPIMALLGTSHAPKDDVVIEDKMVVSEFEYTDTDKDGIYTAHLTAPLVHGEYEIITIMKYRDHSLGSKELRLTTVIDPEGYIFEKIGDKELRLPEARVSLLRMDSEKGFSLWKADEYQQVNPQLTDKSGSYSFLVPEGMYKIRVTVSGYYDFEGKEFEVKEGRGVHENIAMEKRGFFKGIMKKFGII
ncbi:MAG: carboxypeptidase-like regulatory domain-containing protein [Candidatus Paceibacterota bacterium]|jgi:hypothetical protein